MHPAVRAEIRRRIDAEADTDRIVVLDTPLMTETVTKGLVFAAVIVVDTPIEVAVERLVAQRGLSAEDALARISKQISHEERVAGADIVIDNGGDVRRARCQRRRALGPLAGPSRRRVAAGRFLTTQPFSSRKLSARPSPGVRQREPHARNQGIGFV